MKIRVLKLGIRCTDKATGLKGTLTHVAIGMAKRMVYLFQPYGLNPVDGQILERIAVEEERLSFSRRRYEEIELPFYILGSRVRSKTTGFKGMAISFVRHIHGCFHVTIQPSGVLSGSRMPIQHAEFDLRDCVGKMVTKMNEEELRRSLREKPSPSGTGSALTPRIPNAAPMFRQ